MFPRSNNREEHLWETSVFVMKIHPQLTSDKSNMILDHLHKKNCRETVNIFWIRIWYWTLSIFLIKYRSIFLRTNSDKMLLMKIIHNEKNPGVFISHGGVFLSFHSLVWHIHCLMKNNLVRLKIETIQLSDETRICQLYDSFYRWRYFLLNPLSFSNLS